MTSSLKKRDQLTRFVPADMCNTNAPRKAALLACSILDGVFVVVIASIAASVDAKNVVYISFR